MRPVVYRIDEAAHNALAMSRKLDAVVVTVFEIRRVGSGKPEGYAMSFGPLHTDEDAGAEAFTYVDVGAFKAGREVPESRSEVRLAA